MRIGIDASGTFGWRGPSRNIKNLIRQLIRIGGDNHYFLFVPKEPTYELEEKPNFTWVVVKKYKFLPWLNVSLPLSAIRHKPDVMVFPQANFWLWKPTKTIVMTRFATIAPFDDGTLEKMNVFLRKLLFKKVADKVGAVSQFNSTQIQITCGIAEETISVIYNGVDPIFLDNNIPDFNDYGKYILYVGGTEKRKNIPRLLKAYEILASKGVDEKLVLVGGSFTPSNADPEMETFINNHEELSERIVLHGIEMDSIKLASLYRGAKLVVYPSFQEDFGLVSVEAMASGTPLVASRMPSIPEIAGDAAEYFDPFDVEEMADKIEKVLKDEGLRKELTRRGKERVKKFNWEVSARKLISLIEEVAGEK